MFGTNPSCVTYSAVALDKLFSIQSLSPYLTIGYEAVTTLMAFQGPEKAHMLYYNYCA